MKLEESLRETLRIGLEIKMVKLMAEKLDIFFTFEWNIWEYGQWTLGIAHEDAVLSAS